MACENVCCVYGLGICGIIAFVVWLFRGTITRMYQQYVARVLRDEAITEGIDLKDKKEKLFQCVHNYRRELKRELNVLEIGAGPVTNLDYLPNNTKLICLEYNPYFDQYANENIKRHERAISTELVQGNAEDMPFENEAFDVVISTLVLCTVSDVSKCLSEIKRVLKPGGKFLFVEHVADESSLVFVYQVLMNPINKLMYDGCRCTQDTGALVKAANFSNVEMDSFNQENWPRRLSPCIQGVATK